MGKLTEVEVVLQTVSQEQDATNSVGKSYGKGSQQTSHAMAGHFGQLTGSRGVLAAEVAGLVTSQKAGRLGLGSRTTGEAGVEVHHTFHTGSILSGTDRLFPYVSNVLWQ